MRYEVPTGIVHLRAWRGLQASLAKELGITRGAISKWKRVPAERVLEVERILGVPRHMLRPDLYPAPLRERRHG